MSTVVGNIVINVDASSASTAAAAIAKMNRQIQGSAAAWAGSQRGMAQMGQAASWLNSTGNWSAGIKNVTTEAGAMKVLPLAVAGAFHTPIMQPAVERLTAVLQGVSFQAPRIPVIFNVDAQPHQDPQQIQELLVQQVVSPVLWEDSMRYLLDTGIDSFCEIGPGRVLRGLLRRIDRKINCENITC